MFNTKSFYPIHKVKVGQWFNYKMEFRMLRGRGVRGTEGSPYKMVPRMGIELNGLFFPLDLVFFFLTPIPIGFSQLPTKGGGK